MTTRFRCPTGPVADLRELEYISALYQTQSADNIRSEAIVSETDIKLYLLSRYGLDISSKDAIDIIHGLGGKETVLKKEHPTPDKHEETRFLKKAHLPIHPKRRNHAMEAHKRKNHDIEKEDGCLDLVQITGILLIPTFLQMAKDEDQGNLSMPLEDCAEKDIKDTNNFSQKDINCTDNSSPKANDTGSSQKDMEQINYSSQKVNDTDEPSQKANYKDDSSQKVNDIDESSQKVNVTDDSSQKMSNTDDFLLKVSDIVEFLQQMSNTVDSSLKVADTVDSPKKDMNGTTESSQKDMSDTEDSSQKDMNGTDDFPQEVNDTEEFSQKVSDTVERVSDTVDSSQKDMNGNVESSQKEKIDTEDISQKLNVTEDSSQKLNDTVDSSQKDMNNTDDSSQKDVNDSDDSSQKDMNDTNDSSQKDMNGTDDFPQEVNDTDEFSQKVSDTVERVNDTVGSLQKLSDTVDSSQKDMNGNVESSQKEKIDTEDISQKVSDAEDSSQKVNDTVDSSQKYMNKTDDSSQKVTDTDDSSQKDMNNTDDIPQKDKNDTDNLSPKLNDSSQKDINNTDDFSQKDINDTHDFPQKDRNDTRDFSQKSNIDDFLQKVSDVVDFLQKVNDTEDSSQKVNDTDDSLQKDIHIAYNCSQKYLNMNKGSDSKTKENLNVEDSAQLQQCSEGDNVSDNINETQEDNSQRFHAVIQNVLQVMFSAVEHNQRTSETEEPGHYSVRGNKSATIDEQFVKNLLESFHEYDSAADPNLVKDMVHAACGNHSGNINNTRCILDEKSLLNALTHDVRQWKVGCEDNLSTSFQDVFGSEKIMTKNFGNEDESERRHVDISKASIISFPDDNIVTTKKEGQVSSTSIAASHNKWCEHKINDDQEVLDDNFEYCDIESNSLSNSQDATRTKNDVMLSDNRKLKQVFMADFIDTMAVTYISMAFIIFGWLFYFFTSLTYISLFQALSGLEIACDPNFGCSLAETLCRWLTLALFLTVSGFFVIVPVSFGNSAATNSWKFKLASLLFILFYTFLAYFIVYDFRRKSPRSPDGPSKAERWLDRPMFIECWEFSFFFGISLAAVQLFRLAVHIFPRSPILRRKGLQWWLASSSIVKSAYSKSAASKKVEKMVLNAHKMHTGFLSSKKSFKNSIFGSSRIKKAMYNFEYHGDPFVDYGWKQLLSKNLFKEEGIPFSSHLILAQVTQVIMTIFVTVICVVGTERLVIEIKDARDELYNLYSGMPEWLFDLIPTEQMIRVSLYTGTAVGVSMAMILTLIFLPSTVNTVMKLRSGVIPSFHDPSFYMYRCSADTIYVVLPNIIFGLFFSSMLFVFFFSLLTLLFYYPHTRQWMIIIAAWLLGSLITNLCKTLMLTIFRVKIFQGFYRKLPAEGNLYLLLMECWQIGLGAGTICARVFQFVFTSVFWVGRFDVPFLSDDINFLGFHFDSAPTSFRKAILIEEAHSHPYIDRLGAMYMMRLKHGDKFSSDAGACWRNIFVLALMPWLLKYRLVREEKTMLESSSNDKDSRGK